MTMGGGSAAARRAATVSSATRRARRASSSLGLRLALGHRPGEDHVEVGLVAVPAQDGLLDVAGVLQLGQRVLVVAGAVEQLLGGEDGLVGLLDLLAGVGRPSPALPAGLLELEDEVLELVEPLLRGLRAPPARAGSGSADSMRLSSSSTSVHSRARSRATRSGSPGSVSSSNSSSASRSGSTSTSGDSMRATSSAALVVHVLAAGGPAVGGLLDGLQGLVRLGLGVLGGPQLVAGGLELAAQRRLVQLGGLEVAQLVRGVVDHLGGRGPLLLDEGELVVASPRPRRGAPPGRGRRSALRTVPVRRTARPAPRSRPGGWPCGAARAAASSRRLIVAVLDLTRPAQLAVSSPRCGRVPRSGVAPTSRAASKNSAAP